nr:Hydroxymethylpyrimidine ABC transporter substrate-binding component [Enterococcus faecium]
MFLWLKTLYRKRAVTWPFIFYTIIWTLSNYLKDNVINEIIRKPKY